MTFLRTQHLDTTPKGYILTVDVAGNAKEGNTIGLRIGSASNFATAPDNAVFPPSSDFKTGLVAIRATTDSPLIENAQDDVAPASVPQGESILPFLKLSMAARTNEVTLKGFTIVKSGSLDDRAISDVRLYEDTDLDGVPDKNWSIGTHTFSDNRLTLAFDGQDNVLVPKGASASTMTKRFFVTLTFSPLAPPISHR